MKLYLQERPVTQLYLESDAVVKGQDVLYLDIQKGGGEGSRGGKVVGHTESGKPIYQSAARMSVKPSTYRGKEGFTVSGTTASGVKNQRIFTQQRDTADKIKLAHHEHADDEDALSTKISSLLRNENKATNNSDPDESSYDAVGYRKSLDLYLDLSKGNPHRDPTVGHFISGGAGKAMNKQGQEDMSEFMNSLMDKLPGEEMDKT